MKNKSLTAKPCHITPAGNTKLVEAKCMCTEKSAVPQMTFKQPQVLII
jgi:hypothetical protein